MALSFKSHHMQLPRKMLHMAKQPTFNPTMRMVILHGKEQFLMQRYTEMLRDALVSEFGDIDVVTFDGEQATLATVLDEVRTFDLLMRHKLIVIDKADSFVASKERSKTSPRKALERYAESPVEHATVLLRAATWRPGKLDKAVDKIGLVYKLAQLSETDSMRWCVGRAKKAYECECESDAAQLLVQKIGTSLTRLDHELQKLSATVGATKTIKQEDVIQMVGLSREEQAWEIQSVLLSGNLKVAMSKLGELLHVSRQPKELLMWSIVDLTRRLNATSELLDHGRTQGEIRKSLKLFGPSGDSIIAKAKSHQTSELAALFTHAVAIDAKTRSGMLEGEHGLEQLTVHVCEQLGN